MEWYNEPQQWQQDGNKLIVQCDGKTDSWRITRYGYIFDNAPFYYKSVSGDFAASVKFTGNYLTQYDQAGLMVREDETVWMKCGVEYVEGSQQASVVITREFSDWSILPLHGDTTPIWLQVKRIKEAIEVYYSTDGENFIMIRQGYLSTKETLQVGMMCAAPTGEGFEVVFDDFNITT